MKTTTILIALLLFASAPAAAQIPAGDLPGAVQTRETEIREQYELKRKLEEAQEPRPQDGVTDRTREAPAPPADGGTRIIVKHIVADRSEILSEEEVRSVLSSYEGKEMTIRELFTVVEKINELYRAKGYLTARAVLPPQKVEEGTVRIKLVEGRVGSLAVEGNRYTRDGYIINRLSFKEGDLVRLNILEDDLFYFNSTNEVKVRAELKPGKASGTTDVIVKAQESDNYRVSMFVDNAGGRTVGEERIGLTLQAMSLFGFRDALTLGGMVAHGTESGHISYDIPVTSAGTRVGVSHEYSSIRITSGPYKSLNVEGDSYNSGLVLNHPVLVKRTYSVNGFAGFNLKRSSTDFDNETLSTTRTRILVAGGELLAIDGYGTWFSRHAITQGFNDFGGDRSFFKYNGDIVRSLNLPGESMVLLRASGQVSANNLLSSSEQFQIGGVATVRGFYEGLLIGDDGYFVSAEANLPLFPRDASIFDIRLRQTVKGAVFIDHGGAFPYKGAGQAIDHNDYLTSAGIGFLLNFTKNFSGRIDVAFPLGGRDIDPGTARVHFSLRAATF